MLKKKKNQLCPHTHPTPRKCFFSLFDINFTHFSLAVWLQSLCMPRALNTTFSNPFLYYLLSYLQIAAPIQGEIEVFPQREGSVPVVWSNSIQRHTGESVIIVSFTFAFGWRRPMQRQTPGQLFMSPGCSAAVSICGDSEDPPSPHQPNPTSPLLRVVIIFNCWPYLPAPPPNVTCLPARGGSDAALHGAS